MRIHCTNSFVQILCGFHRTGSIVQLPLCGFHHYGFHRADAIQIPSCRFHPVGTIVRIPFHRASSIVRIMCIPLCASHCVHSIVCILLYALLHRRKEEVKEDRGWAHWRIVFTFVFASPLVSTGVHPLRVYWVRAHRLGAHQPDCIVRVVCV